MASVIKPVLFYSVPNLCLKINSILFFLIVNIFWHMKEALYNHSGPVQQTLIPHSSSMALSACPHASSTTAMNRQKKKALKRNTCVSLWTPLMSLHVTRSSRRKYPLLCSHSFYTHTAVTSLRMIDIGVCAHEWLYPYMCVYHSQPLCLSYPDPGD